MQKKKKDWETLRDTGMLGAYQPEEVSLQELPSGEVLPPVFGYGTLGVPGPAGAQTGDGDRREGVPYRLGLPREGRNPLPPPPENCSPISTGSCKKIPMDFEKPVWYPVVAVPLARGKGGSER